MRRLIIAACIASLLSLSYAGPASAAPAAAGGDPITAKLPPQDTDQQKRNKGLMFVLNVGVDDCTDDWCDNVDPSFGLSLVVMYRIMKWFAVGLHTAFLIGDPDDNYGFVGPADSLWAFYLAAEGRGLFPYKNFEAWAAMSFGYMRVMSSGDFGGTTIRGWADNFALGFGFGADYYVWRNLAVGLGFYLYKPFIFTVCGDDGTNSDCFDLDDSQERDVGVIWHLFASIKFMLPL
ncbi:MAG: hypothetical protein ABI333_16760 [bacterium]